MNDTNEGADFKPLMCPSNALPFYLTFQKNELQYIISYCVYRRYGHGWIFCDVLLLGTNLTDFIWCRCHKGSFNEVYFFI